MSREKEEYGYFAVVKWVIGILLAVLLFFVLNSSLLNVNSITVIGAERFSQQDIINVSGIDYQTNIFHVDEQKAKENIEATPYLKVENIKRTFFCGVEIYVSERTPAAQIPTVKGYYVIDKECVALGLNQIEDVNLIKITGLTVYEPTLGKKVENGGEDQINGLAYVLGYGEEYGILSRISEIDITDENKTVLIFDGITVKLGDASASKEKLRILDATVNAVRDKITDGKVLNMETEGAFFVG